MSTVYFDLLNLLLRYLARSLLISVPTNPKSKNICPAVNATRTVSPLVDITQLKMLEWDPDHVPKVKLGLHVAQILLAFAAWCLELGVFTGGKVVGLNGWTFAVVRLFPVALSFCLSRHLSPRQCTEIS